MLLKPIYMASANVEITSKSTHQINDGYLSIGK